MNLEEERKKNFFVWNNFLSFSSSTFWKRFNWLFSLDLSATLPCVSLPDDFYCEWTQYYSHNENVVELGLEKGLRSSAFLSLWRSYIHFFFLSGIWPFSMSLPLGQPIVSSREGQKWKNLKDQHTGSETVCQCLLYVGYVKQCVASLSGHFQINNHQSNWENNTTLSIQNTLWWVQAHFTNKRFFNDMWKNKKWRKKPPETPTFLALLSRYPQLQYILI